MRAGCLHRICRRGCGQCRCRDGEDGRQGHKDSRGENREGTEHTFHFIGKTVAHGAEATAKGSKDAFEGMKEGDDVIVHYTVKGSRKDGAKRWITSARTA